ncbi:phage shock protein A [Bacillus pseudomycoides]|uniref:Phage shock protein A n=1 Tax=Bacillus pseudomycoides TaxID=64104 RepID=A0ABD6T3T6_9BACI|nr:PspA/IM30 family protein [Bacillus pseudomycoides]EEM05266.1 PspA/IM30 [Bacillus pseudomycoides]MBD5798586.1 phage shock protein A [Bacillus pseudomycoides]MED1476278.1 PspA/IM30 family protein [Bacillus pseudomycoides]PDZ10715.1 phage shock protein A [Bacillus pseudomycoides]PEO92470.1 phage shock protein A [Bacillus pseudomycoides]
MSIFRRIKNIVTADVHEALNKLENPVSMLKQYIRETEQQVVKAQQALSQQLFLEKKYESLITGTEAVIAKRFRQAELAVSRNEDDMAQLALQEKIAHEKKLEMYHEQYNVVKQQTSILYEQIDKLQKEYQELQYKELVLVSRLHVARTMKENNETFASFHTENAVKGFARVESYIQKIEAEASASNYFNQIKPISYTDDTEIKLKEAVQKELEKLKVRK